MQLVAEISIPKKEKDLLYTLDKAELEKLRKASILSLEGYVLIAIRMSYGHKKPSIDSGSFCEEWKITEAELDIAIAKLQKKGLLYREPKAIQLELFEAVKVED
jgi:DNA-binding MarR family transcriptional regulator